MSLTLPAPTAHTPLFGTDAPLCDPKHWALDPTLTFLNHGSYGACLHEVLAAQTAIRTRTERDPVRFYKVEMEGIFDEVRRSLGQFCNCPANCIAPAMNATVALATIFYNYFINHPVKPGDEILVTDHEYSSGVNELTRLAAQYGFRVVTAKIPFPINSPEQVTEAVVAAITPRTRLALISHVTTTTSLVFPIQTIVDEFNRRGIDVVVDGAHAPGQVEVDIAALNPTYYVGSLHKWFSSPKGTGFAYVRPDHQTNFRTLALSSRADKVRPERPLFLRDFDYMGTADYSSLMAIPATFAAMNGLIPGGWPAIRAHNHALVLKARQIVCDATGLTPPAPASMVASMASLILPPAPAHLASRRTIYDDPLQDILVDRHRLQVPIWPWNKHPTLRIMRISAQVYNFANQFHTLATALNAELSSEQPAIR